MRRVSSSLFGVGLVVVLGGIARPALGDWPTSRHDPARTAYAAGTATITKPTPYWEAYAGGTLSSSTHIALDIDGDGIVDLIYLAGGKAIVKHADDLVVWESKPLDFSKIEAVADLDGSGVLELVVSTGRNVFVLAGATGKVLWENPDGEVGNIGGVRLADLDGDTHPEIVIDDCACCGVSAIASPAGGVYHFPMGMLGAPTKLYAPLTRSHCGSSAVTIGDFDGDGKADVAYPDDGTAILTTGATGATLGASAAIGHLLYYSSCTSANVDGRPGDELICFENTYEASTMTGGRRVFAVTYDPTASPVVKSLYNLAPVPVDVGQLQSLGNSLTDLDGDGLLEITVSWYDGSAWSTSIYDAGTGMQLATVAERIDGIVDVDGDKLPELVTTTAAGLVARKFKRGATPPLTPVVTFPSGYHVRTQYNYTQSAAGSLIGQPLAIDLQGNGSVVPVFLVDASGPATASYVAAHVVAGSVATLATYSVPAGLSILTNQVYANLNRPYPQLVLARNDGYLTFLDSAFAPTNGGTFGSGEFPEVLPGMRVGGFIAAPIAPRLGGTSDSVVVSDSRGALVNLSAAAAWMSVPPTTAWRVPGAGSPTTAPTIDSGKPGIVCTGGSTLTALHADGTTIWTRAMPGGAGLSGDPLTGDVNGDGVSDVFTASLAAGGLLNLQVWSGKDGTPIWPAAYTEAQQWGYEPFALADYDGDGIPDMFVVSNTLRILGGPTGKTIASNPTFLAYFTPTIVDVDGDGIPDITLSRGYYPVRTVKHDLTTTLWTGADDRPYQHGAYAACSGGQSVWVQPSTQTQGLVRLSIMNGPSAGMATTLYLAGGVAYMAAADATAAGGFLGLLGNVVVKQDLLGTGDHPSALMGSSDGFLYALNPCAGTLDWAYDLKFAVGNPILADTTGSGADQILVPAADGYIHALQQLVLAAPAYVYDNAVVGGVTVVGPDLDTVQTGNALGASWAPVAGADGYQVAALTEGGTFITQPDWVSVGNVTSAAVTNLSLGAGKKYFFSVRAVSKTKGSSLDTTSNGIVVETPVAPDGGIFGDAGFPEDDAGADAGGPQPDGGAMPPGGPSKSSGCGCRAAGADGSLGGAAACALALLGVGARRRTRRRAR